MKISYTTTMSSKTNRELRKLLEETQNEEAIRELLIRSVNDYFPEFDNTLAIIHCYRQLRQKPNDPLYNLVYGCLTGKVENFEKAARAGKSSGLIAAQAAHELAIKYIDENEYIKAGAWVALAILTGSEAVEDAFFGEHCSSHGFNPGYLSMLQDEMPEQDRHPANKDKAKLSSESLSLCIFLTLLLADIKFERQDFRHSGWLAYWNNYISGLILKAQYDDRSNTVINLMNKGSPAAAIARKAFSKDPLVFLEYFYYAAIKGVIPENVFGHLMELFFHSAKWQKIEAAADGIDAAEYINLTDKAYYKLFLFFIGKQDYDRALKCFDQLSEKFEDYDLDDLDFLRHESKNSVYYNMFKRLTQHKLYDMAYACLCRVNIDRFTAFDSAIFEFFAAADPKQNNYAYYEKKRAIFNRIKASADHYKNDRVFLGQVDKDAALLESKIYQIRMHFLRMASLVEEYRIEREARKKEHPWRLWLGEEKRQQFFQSARELGSRHELDHAYCLTSLDFGKLCADVGEWLAKWEPRLHGPHVSVLFSRLREALIAAENINKTVKQGDYDAYTCMFTTDQPAPASRASVYALYDDLQSLSRAYPPSFTPQLLQPADKEAIQQVHKREAEAVQQVHKDAPPTYAEAMRQLELSRSMMSPAYAYYLVPVDASVAASGVVDVAPPVNPQCLYPLFRGQEKLAVEYDSAAAPVQQEDVLVQLTKFVAAERANEERVREEAQKNQTSSYEQIMKTLEAAPPQANNALPQEALKITQQDVTAAPDARQVEADEEARKTAAVELALAWLPKPPSHTPAAKSQERVALKM